MIGVTRWREVARWSALSPMRWWRTRLNQRVGESGFHVVAAAVVCVLLPLVLPASAAESDVPQIELWYGDEQRFGEHGNPQPRINLLGVVSNSAAVESLSFSVNGGTSLPLSMGPNGFRLSRTGGFNAEIERSSLRPGENVVELIAQPRFSNQPITRTVRVHYTSG